MNHEIGRDKQDHGILISLLVLFYRRKAALLIAILGCSLLFLGGSYLVSPRYGAKVRVIPSSAVSGESGMSNAGGLLSLAQGVGINLSSGGSDPTVLIPEILRSNDFITILLKSEFGNSDDDQESFLSWVIDDTGLDEAEFEKISRFLRKDVLDTSYDSKSGVTTISVVFSDPVLAVNIANECVTMIDDFNLKMRSSQASKEEEFILQRMAEVQIQLTESEDKLTKFRLKNRQINQDPALQAEEARLKLAFRLSQDLYLTLRQQKEISTIQKLRSVPSLRILETARPSLKKVSPKRGSFLIGGAFIGFALMGLYIVLRPSFKEFLHIARRDGLE